jgi:hypothetical protein
MQWDELTRQAVDVALNEADVLGLRLASSGAWCELLLHVLALPETGPPGDVRRILRLTRPAQVRVLLRALERARLGAVIPLAGLGAVEEFFASLTWSDSMYGWRFLDAPSLTDDWPARPSLSICLGAGAGSHSLYWFSECGCGPDSDSPASYCIEGVVTFEDLQLLRADATPLPLEQFIADGQRYWRSLHARDGRLSVSAQRAAQYGTPSWRPVARNAVMVSGSGTGQC